MIFKLTSEACKSQKRAKDAIKEISNKLKGKKHGQLEYYYCDLSSLESVQDFIQKIKRKERFKLRYLINNAAIMACPFQRTLEGYEMQFGVNYLAHFLLSVSLVDIIAQNNGRIVFVASAIHKFVNQIRFDNFKIKLQREETYDRYFAYSHSKLLLVMLTKHLSLQYDSKDVQFIAVHPGVVATQVARHLWFPFRNMNHYFMKYIGRKPEEGAITSVFACLEENLSSGVYLENCKVVEPNPLVNDVHLTKKLWKASEHVTKKWKI